VQKRHSKIQKWIKKSSENRSNFAVSFLRFVSLEKTLFLSQHFAMGANSNPKPQVSIPLYGQHSRNHSLSS
jgi:hypothetical protein